MGELASKSPFAVVTGASSGIGAELALQLSLSLSGMRVLAVARRGELLAQRAQAAGGAAIEALALDLTAPRSAAQIARRAEALGGADWLVNDAGVNRFGAFREADAAATGQMIRLNCEALVGVTSTLLPKMLERRRGVILNVSSVAGFVPTPFMAVYGATKAFVLSYSEALRAEPVARRFQRKVVKTIAPAWLVATGEDLREGNAFQHYAKVSAPVLLAWGLRDRWLDFDTLVSGTEQWVPNLRVERLPGAHHFIQVERAPEVNALLTGFFRALV